MLTDEGVEVLRGFPCHGGGGGTKSWVGINNGYGRSHGGGDATWLEEDENNNKLVYIG